MPSVSPQTAFRRDRDGLRDFLAYCREEARHTGSPRLASLSLAVRHIDPLAVLESVHDPAELHFYMECPAAEEAVAGADAVAAASFSGPERFAAARRFSQDLLDTAICAGDSDLPFGGPHVFCAFAFDAEQPADAPFPSALVFIPRWQVARKGDDYVAVANLIVEPQADIERLADRVWAAHRKFESYAYGGASRPKETEAPCANGAPGADVGGPGSFERSVTDALGRIGQGAYRKIVLARAVDIVRSQPFDPLESLNRLRGLYPVCHAFSFGNAAGLSFIGATPERLLRVHGGVLETEALAGSAPRGRTAREDAELGAGLLASDKDLREHALVLESIERRLRALGLDPVLPVRPRLLQLANVQHLRSPVRATLPPHVHLLDAAAELHPTPAVGGTPREPALVDIKRLEPFARGLYAGAIGWFDHRGDGELVVGLRCALIDGPRARLYAGAGIVAGSDAERERAETDVKFQAMLQALR